MAHSAPAQFGNAEEMLSAHRATRPTGNWSPALDDWLTDFFAVFPLPRPDMVAVVSVGKGLELQEEAGGGESERECVVSDARSLFVTAAEVSDVGSINSGKQRSNLDNTGVVLDSRFLFRAGLGHERARIPAFALSYSPPLFQLPSDPLLATAGAWPAAPWNSLGLASTNIFSANSKLLVHLGALLRGTARALCLSLGRIEMHSPLCKPAACLACRLPLCCLLPSHSSSDGGVAKRRPANNQATQLNMLPPYTA